MPNIELLIKHRSLRDMLGCVYTVVRTTDKIATHQTLQIYFHHTLSGLDPSCCSHHYFKLGHIPVLDIIMANMHARNTIPGMVLHMTSFKSNEK